MLTELLTVIQGLMLVAIIFLAHGLVKDTKRARKAIAEAINMRDEFQRRKRELDVKGQKKKSNGKADAPYRAF